MNSYLINKNLCFYYHMRHLLGKKRALKIAKFFEIFIR